MRIHQLSEAMINQIAAGEVVERPASVVKELVENAIDAKATRIEIATAGGGKSLIRVSDNGHGIQADELVLAISRHCTSKLEENIHEIHALGFRGEALPSIGFISHLRLLSRTANASAGAEISISGGKIDGPRPAASNCGTLAEVRDLFHVMPARLKFMKTDQVEATAIADTIRRIAIAFPHVHFTLSGPSRKIADFPATGKSAEVQAHIARLIQILGKEFSENTVPLDMQRDNIRLTGFAGIPSYNRGNSLQQFIYVNGRLIRDRIITSVVRAAYADIIARDRYGIVVLFIAADPFDVDVNVHPAKADVRFRNPGLIRSLIVGSIREALVRAGIRSSKTSAEIMLNAFQLRTAPDLSLPMYCAQKLRSNSASSFPVDAPQNSATASIMLGADFSEEEHVLPITKNHVPHAPLGPDPDMNQKMIAPVHSLLTYPLGTAMAQIHQNYIIAQTENSLIIVDQHAAHERLVYEDLKQALYTKKPLSSQILLVPEIIDLPEAERLLEHVDILRQFGLILESFGSNTIIVRETPAILGNVNAAGLVRDLADEVAEYDTRPYTKN